MLGVENISQVQFNGEPKKDYLFTWSLVFPYNNNTSANNGIYNENSTREDMGKYLNIDLGNRDNLKDSKMSESNKSIFDSKKPTLNYISQLAQKVDLPQESLELITDYQMGEIETVIPFGKKYNDIQVSYVDDVYENVYKFHYGWLSLIRKHKRPIYKYCLEAYYHTVSFDAEKYVEGDVYFDENNKKPYLYRFEYDDNGAVIGGKNKLQQSNYFPRIFPKTIQRTSADKTGNNIGGVTVTYGQLIIPKVVHIGYE